MIEQLRQLVNPMLTFLGAYICYHNTRYTSRFIQSFAPFLLLVLSLCRCVMFALRVAVVVSHRLF